MFDTEMVVWLNDFDYRMLTVKKICENTQKS